MKVTPDIVRFELIGLEAKIHMSSNPENIGISGRVVDETRNTLSLLSESRRRMIPKQSNLFHFKFPDETIVEIDGAILVGRPEDRLKKSIRRLW